MAKVIAQTQTNTVLVEMTVADARKISGNTSLKLGDEFEISPLYNAITKIQHQKAKLLSIANQLENAGQSLKAAVNSLGDL